VYSWGTGAKGRLGHDNEDCDVLKPMMIQSLSSQKVETISAGESHSAAITNTKKLWTWGNNTYGRLGLGMDGAETKQVSLPSYVSYFESQSAGLPIFVSCGAFHTLVSTDNGRIYGFG